MGHGTWDMGMDMDMDMGPMRGLLTMTTQARCGARAPRRG